MHARMRADTYACAHVYVSTIEYNMFGLAILVRIRATHDTIGYAILIF